MTYHTKKLFISLFMVMPLLVASVPTHTICPLSKTTQFFTGTAIGAYLCVLGFRYDYYSSMEKGNACQTMANGIRYAVANYITTRKNDPRHITLSKTAMTLLMQTELSLMLADMEVTIPKKYHRVIEEVRASIENDIKEHHRFALSTPISDEQFEEKLLQYLENRATELITYSKACWITYAEQHSAKYSETYATVASVSTVLGMLSHFYLS